MFNADVENLISRLSGGLHPADRAAFRSAAEAAVNAPGECWGEGLIHRTITAIWKHYFIPPVLEDHRYGARRARGKE